MYSIPIHFIRSMFSYLVSMYNVQPPICSIIELRDSGIFLASQFLSHSSAGIKLFWDRPSQDLRVSDVIDICAFLVQTLVFNSQ